MKVAYFVSGHGFGHISRSLEIIKVLLSYGHSVCLFTERGNFLEGFKSENLQIIPISTDLGLAQTSSLEIDLQATKYSIQNFQSRYDDLKENILRLLKKFSPDRIISDASSFPFPLAKSLGIKSVFLGNFTWDFIYSHYGQEDPFFETYAKLLSKEYSYATIGLVLPFHCPVEHVPNLQYTGLVGRKPTMNRGVLRKMLGFEDNKLYFLFSFGAYGLDSKKFNFKNLYKDIEIITSGLVDFQGPKVREITGVSYPNLLHACDAVVTKPGYGILAESYFAGTPILYTDRGNFREYDYLVTAMNRYHRSAYISQDNLFDLNLQEYFNHAVSIDSPREKLLDGIPEIIPQIL